MFVGNSEAINCLNDLLKCERMCHAYTFSGPEGVGKSIAAKHFAYAFLSGHGYMDSDYSSVESSDLWARMHGGSCGNYLYITRGLSQSTGKLSKDINADSVRGLQEFFAKSAFEPGWRVVIIDSADDLNKQSANSLLKILEEPPNMCLFILISHTPGRLLPTLRSRTQGVVFKTIDDDDMSILCAVNNLNQDLIKFASGSFGIVKKWSEYLSPSLLKNFDDLMGRDLMRESNASSGDGVIAFVESLLSAGKDVEDLIISFSIFVQSWINQYLRVHFTEGKSINVARLRNGSTTSNIYELANRAMLVNTLSQNSYDFHLDPKQSLALMMYVAMGHKLKGELV